jgi:hypothetical protein
MTHFAGDRHGGPATLSHAPPFAAAATHVPAGLPPGFTHMAPDSHWMSARLPKLPQSMPAETTASL